jgi:ketosteroid isomerase-like protein
VTRKEVNMAAATITTNEGRIRELTEDRAKAVYAKDLDALVASYAPDVEMFSLAPPLRARGTDRRGLAAWLASWEGPINDEVHELTVVAGDDVAFSHSLNHLRGTKTDGQAIDLWLRTTVCFRKLGSEWRVTHEHSSVPFDMASGRAALDLQP